MALLNRRRIARLLCAGLAVAAISISGGCPPPDENGDGPGQDVNTLVGVWEHEGTSILTDFVVGQITFLVLNDDATAELLTRDPETNVLGCHDGIYVSLDSGRVIAQFSDFEDVQLLLSAQADADTLELVDALGGTSTFSRVSAVAEGARCGTLEVVRRFTTGLPNPHFFGGLAFDGTDLWYEEDLTQRVFPVNPNTGVPGAPVDLSMANGFSHVHAVQAGDFWAHCGCGGSQEAQRRTPAGVLVDEVDTETDLGSQISVRGIAYDSVGNILWLHGSGRNDNIGRFLKVNSNAEPDVLLEQRNFDAFINALTWDGTNLWALVGFANQAVIVQISPTTFQALATFENPDSTIQWQGIAAVGGNLFLSGRTDTNDGVLFEVTP